MHFHPAENPLPGRFACLFPAPGSPEAGLRHRCGARRDQPFPDEMHHARVRYASGTLTERPSPSSLKATRIGSGGCRQHRLQARHFCLGRHDPTRLGSRLRCTASGGKGKRASCGRQSRPCWLELPRHGPHHCSSHVLLSFLTQSPCQQAHTRVCADTSVRPYLSRKAFILCVERFGLQPAIPLAVRD
jgi:hypothetical protein